MKFILYSAVTAESIADNLGLPEYSYYFVLKEIRPLLDELGEVELVSNPELEVDAIYEQCRANGQRCVFIAFAPPHKAPVGLACPTVSVFAWEFDNIPYEAWGDEPRNDWRYVFGEHGRAISLSSHSAKTVKETMGADFNIAAIPVPVWDLFAHGATSAAQGKVNSLAISGAVIDSNSYELTAESIIPHDTESQFQFPAWEGEKLQMEYTREDDDCSYLGGFYPAERWGSWSKTSEPWVLIPKMLCGSFTVAIHCAAYGPNAGRDLDFVIGGQTRTAKVVGGFSVIELDFNLDKPANLIRFRGLSHDFPTTAQEMRPLGLALKSIVVTAIDVPGGAAVPALASPKVTGVSGIVYTSVFNPVDGRKNWMQIVSAFCYTFREEEGATLILKMTQKSLTTYLGRLHNLLQLLAPYKCRVIALHGFLDDDDYQRLVSMTSYYVGASGGEGLCLPMMEYMSAGKPTISTCNTAMEDYVDEHSAFIVASDIEPSFWPHDPRERLRTHRHRIDWASLTNAFRDSYALAMNEADQYQKMSHNARENLRKFASRDVVKARLQAFFLDDGAALSIQDEAD